MDLHLNANKDTTERLFEILNKLINRQRQFKEVIMNKCTHRLIDFNFLYSKRVEIQNQIDQFVWWIRNSFLLEQKATISNELKELKIEDSIVDLGQNESSVEKQQQAIEEDVREKMKEM